jgi:hypothetical protein
VRAAALPVFLVLVGLFVLTHLPLILVVLVLFLVWAKATGWRHHRHWRDRARSGGWQGDWYGDRRRR